MSDATPRFGLPFLLPGQAQKEHYHNEALSMVDLVLHAVVEGAPLQSPPIEPQEGQCWIVAAGAAGAWAGKDDRLAGWTEGGWRFIEPKPGMAVWNRASGYRVHWESAGWSEGILPVAGLAVNGLGVVGERQPAIPTPSNGTTIDEEARLAIGRIIAALMSHGLIA